MSGVNHPFILCDPNNSSLYINVYYNTLQLVHWVWKGLTFHGCTGFLPPDHYDYPPIHHENFQSVVMHDCSLMMLTRVHVQNVSQVTISNSVFTQSFNDSCSTLVADLKSFQFPIKNAIFIFLNNVISNYTCYHNAEYTDNFHEPFDIASMVQITNSYDNVTFANHIIMNISFSEYGYHFNVFSVLSGSQGEMVIRNNSFVRINYSGLLFL